MRAVPVPPFRADFPKIVLAIPFNMRMGPILPRIGPAIVIADRISNVPATRVAKRMAFAVGDKRLSLVACVDIDWGVCNSNNKVIGRGSV
jgi:hypothetical protein